MPNKMRYIQIPKPIKLLNPDTEEPMKDTSGKDLEPVTLLKFLTSVSLNVNPVWGASLENVDAHRAILEELRRCDKDGDPMAELAQDDWEKLEKTIRGPEYYTIERSMMGDQQRRHSGFAPPERGGYHQALLPQLLPLMKAITQAAETRPKKEKEPKADKNGKAEEQAAPEAQVA